MPLKVLEFKSGDTKSVDDVIAEVKALDPQPIKILVLYETTERVAGELDNGMTISECLFMLELFKHWLMKCAYKE